MNWIEKKVDEFLFKLNRLTPAGGFMLENGNYGHGMLSEIFISDWLRTALQEAYQRGVEECKVDCKQKAETAALMALNACGVPEEEAVKHARIAVDSVF